MPVFVSPVNVYPGALAEPRTALRVPVIGAVPATGIEAVSSLPMSVMRLLKTVLEIVVPDVTGIPAVPAYTPLPFLGIV